MFLDIYLKIIEGQRLKIRALIGEAKNKKQNYVHLKKYSEVHGILIR